MTGPDQHVAKARGARWLAARARSYYAMDYEPAVALRMATDDLLAAVCRKLITDELSPDGRLGMAVQHMLSKERQRYRGYVIRFQPPPVSGRQFDWSYAHEDYDGAPDSGDDRCGHAASFKDACEEIDEKENE